MKFLVICIILTISLFNLVKSQGYVTFQPYINSKCSGDQTGVGYSFLLNQCISSVGDVGLENTNWKFNYDQTTNYVISQQYDSNDCSGEPINVLKYFLNDCSQIETFFSMENFTYNQNETTYATVTIGNLPIYTKDQVIYEYHSKTNSGCSSLNLLFSLFFTPNIIFDQGKAITKNYFCVLGLTPFERYCDYNNWPETCTTNSIANSCTSSENNNLNLKIYCKTIFN
ncbi:hypothetical protein RB653_005562 [Dictyostelium firmibasis]|uniref:Transmembrane protein n=1 Tax=Dictyostelium firmibasis TaxID=79012 RepID=A0AAN7YZC7_9MYCE